MTTARARVQLVARRMKIPATKYPVERFTLGNGLRVVLTPDRSAPVVGVAVAYDVGIRSEPEGRRGFAHLFEHLMFQGSENLEKLARFRHVQGAGGSFNGSTPLDYTDYFEVLPAGALERALFLEADRMRGPRLTEENLLNQIDVVKEEMEARVAPAHHGGTVSARTAREELAEASASAELAWLRELSARPRERDRV